MNINQIELKKAILLLVMCTLFLLAFYPVWTMLVSKWSTSDEYSYGFLILPICSYIIYQKRKELSRIPIIPTRLGLVVIAGSLLIYYFSLIVEVATLSSVSMVFTIIGIVLYLFGWNCLKTLSFPLVLMFLMIPVPSQIYATMTIPLQLLVSKISHFTMLSFGLPIYREGNVIFTPQATLEVVQACSGLRSMISLFTLSLVFGYFMLRSKFLIIFLSFLSIPITILGNVLRVTITILALHFFEYDLTVGAVHTIYGLIIFLIDLAIIVIISKVLSQWDSFKQENSSY